MKASFPRLSNVFGVHKYAGLSDWAFFPFPHFDLGPQALSRSVSTSRFSTFDIRPFTCIPTAIIDACLLIYRRRLGDLSCYRYLSNASLDRHRLLLVEVLMATLLAPGINSFVPSSGIGRQVGLSPCRLCVAHESGASASTQSQRHHPPLPSPTSVI